MYEQNEAENLQQILNSEVINNINGLSNYINNNDAGLTEELLSDNQIIDLVTQSVTLDSNSSNEEQVLISHKEGLDALTTFIEYFKQQMDAEFKIEDLNILKKYNNI
ncbi:12128_t:CDS:2, partial [Racocetra fulgida]